VIRRRVAAAFLWLALTGAAGGGVRFAAVQQPPPPDFPPEARRIGVIADIRDQGPLGVLVSRRLAALEVTWWDPKVFVKEAAVREYLARLLENQRGGTVTFIPWAQRLQVAHLAVDVIETGGRRGRLLLWHQLPSIYAGWRDADGHWWFAYWMDDPDLRVPADGP
jgi:hypothetical protein